MQPLNEEKWLKTIELLEKAAEVNEKTQYCVDADWHGPYNEMEFRVSLSKEPGATGIMIKTIDCTGEFGYSYEEDVEELENQLDELLNRSK